MAAEAEDDGNILLANSGKIVAVIGCGFAAAVAFTAMAEQLGAASEIEPVILSLVAALLVIIGWTSRSNQPSEFFVGGHRLSPSANALGGLAGGLAVPAFAGVAGLFFTYGFDGLAFAIGPMAGIVLSGIALAPYLAASKASTVPEFLGQRYGRAVRVVSALIIAGVCLVIFATSFASASGLAAQMFEVPLPEAVAASLALIALSTIPGGFNSLTWTGVVTSILFLAGLSVLTAGLSLSGFGHPLVPLAAGQALQSVSNLEFSMIEKGVADPATLKAFARPFLQIDSVNTFGLIFSLMAATAALPQLLHRSLSVRSPQAARSSAAWLLGLVLVATLSASALAIFAKVEVVTLVERGTPFAALPDWMGELGNGDGVNIHGVSVALVQDVASAVKTGAGTSGDVGQAFNANNASRRAQWASLKDPVKTAMIDVVKSAPPGAGSAYLWTAMREKVLPVAALAAGNKTGSLNWASLRLDAVALIGDVPRILGRSATAMALAMAAALFSALAVASAALFNAAAVLGRDLWAPSNHGPPTSSQVLGARLLMVLLGVAAAAVLIWPVPGWPAADWLRADWMTLVEPALSAAAAGLLPVLILGIWWRRANAFGALSGMLTGVSAALVYGLGTQFFAVPFYAAWPSPSAALPAAVKKFEALQNALGAAQSEQAAVIAAALKTHAAGSPFAPGVANWLGLGGASALVFALPLAFLVLILASLISPRPSSAQLDFVSKIRRPQDKDGDKSTDP